MPDALSSPNQALLDEVNAAGSWFHAKKTRPIWVRRLAEPTRVQTLEGEEEVPAGAYLCRGEAGDVWPQSAERLQAKYVAGNESSADGWQRYDPHPDAAGVMAVQIDHAFTVHAEWGELTGKAGDFLVKNFEDRDILHPSDVWIVDQRLFQATYAAVTSKN